MTFDIDLSLLDNGDFSVIENTAYSALTFDEENIGHYKFIECLSYTTYAGVKSIVANSTVYTDIIDPLTPASTFAGNFNYTFTLTKDGSYMYHKIALIKYDYATLPLVENDIYWNNNKIYIYDGTVSTELTLLQLLDSFEHIDASFQASFFSMAEITKCLISYQEKLLPIFIECSKDFKADKQKRDFLLDLNYIIHYLIHIDNTLEAQRLIERLDGCVSLCTTTNINKLNTCNCG